MYKVLTKFFQNKNQIYRIVVTNKKTVTEGPSLIKESFAFDIINDNVRSEAQKNC